MTAPPSADGVVIGWNRVPWYQFRSEAVYRDRIAELRGILDQDGSAKVVFWKALNRLDEWEWDDAWSSDEGDVPPPWKKSRPAEPLSSAVQVSQPPPVSSLLTSVEPLASLDLPTSSSSSSPLASTTRASLLASDDAAQKKRQIIEQNKQAALHRRQLLQEKKLKTQKEQEIFSVQQWL
jgi:hypothetical protein